MSKRAKIVTVLAACLATAGVFAYLLSTSVEPRYNSRSLDSWVESFIKSRGHDQEARKAITAIVTNCAPALVHRLEYNPRPREARMESLVRFIPTPLLRDQRV